MRTNLTRPRTRSAVAFGSVIVATAMLAGGEVDSLARAAIEDKHASVSDKNITVITVLSTVPEEIAPNLGTSPLPVDVGPLPSPNAVLWFGRPASKRQKSLSDKMDFPYGDDYSDPVEDLLEFPYRTIVHIESTLGQCSGAMYGPDVVLTAGHCVFKHAWATDVKVRAARPTTGPDPFGTCTSVALFSTSGWKSSEDEEYDYGAIKLDCSVGNQTGWLGYGWSTTDVVKTQTTVAGYRHEAVFENGGTRRLMRWGPGYVKVFVDPLLFYDNSTQPTQSGAPVLAYNPSRGRILGVHAKGCHHLTSNDCISGDPDPHRSWNHGTMITREVFQNMQAWRSVTVP